MADRKRTAGRHVGDGKRRVGEQTRQTAGKYTGETADTGGAMSKRQRGEATRADIVDVSRRLFSKYGYHHTSISDIQAATGLTKGAFYHHFRTKEDLALAVLETARADYGAKLFGPAMEGQTPGDRLRLLLDGVVALNQRADWCNCRMMVILCAELTLSDERLTDTVRKMQEVAFEIWTELIAQAQASNEANQAVAAEVAAQWIMSSLSGAIVSEKIGTAQVPLAEVVASFKKLLLKPNAGKVRAGSMPPDDLKRDD